MANVAEERRKAQTSTVLGYILAVLAILIWILAKCIPRPQTPWVVAGAGLLASGAVFIATGFLARLLLDLHESQARPTPTAAPETPPEDAPGSP